VFRWVSGVAVGAVMLALAVGCGGGDDPTTEVTKAEFTKQANAICDEAKATRKPALDNLNKELQQIAKVRQVSEKMLRKVADKMIHETMVPSLEDQLRHLEELGSPVADEATVSKMLQNLSDGTDEMEEDSSEFLVKGGKLLIFQEEAATYGLSCVLF
jgi:hypothetical protein